eukprot:gene20004-23969_t
MFLARSRGVGATTIIRSNISNNGFRGYSTAGPSDTLLEQPKKLKILRSTTDDPLLNIATEDWLFKTFDLDTQTLFLWRNAPCVIIGRFQNPFKECHLQRMQEEGVTLARRYSGGGAVYQDRGNSIFTFLSPMHAYNKTRNTEILTKALDRFGVSATASGRNDVIVDGRKVSGAAFKQSGKRAFHHGTMMLDVELQALERFLNPSKEKLKAKGISSVIARVCNLRTIVPTITHEAWNDALIESFQSTYNARCDIEDLPRDQLLAIPSLKETYDGLSAWDWRYGTTPPFEHQFEKRFDWGTLDINMNCEKGIIQKVKIYSDALNPLMIEIIAENLMGMRYDSSGITTALDRVKTVMASTPGADKEIEELKQWLIQAI